MDKEAIRKGLIFLTERLHAISETEIAFPTWCDQEIVIRECRDYASLNSDPFRMHVYLGKSAEFIRQRESHFNKEGIDVCGNGRLGDRVLYVLTREEE